MTGDGAGHDAGPADVDGDAAALLAGPWHADPMQTRVAQARGHLVVPAEVVLLVRSTLLRFRDPPEAGELVAFLRSRPALLDPRSTVTDLCRLLDIDAAELDWFADEQQRGRRTVGPLQHYRWRTLPKRGGVRLVAAPKPRLKEIQRRLLRHVLAPVGVHPAAHGCVPGRSVRTAVEPHAGARVVVRLDLESFFPTITAGRVDGLLRALGAADATARVIAALCTTTVPVAVWAAVARPADERGLDAHVRLGRLLREPHVPQGAPSSPALANAVAFGLDRRLAALAARYELGYTRYVDDLTFSGGRGLLTHRAAFIDAVTGVVRSEGFRVAGRKTAVLTSAGRLGALGAVFNEHPSRPRPERDLLRAIVHNCVRDGGASQARGRPRFREELLGRISALGALDPARAARLRADYDRIEWG